ncbi:MAG: tRNA (guanosine(37)-N1)-methyltransferase TrmD [Gammaproteobacteria bacterium]|nr:tRNA (guanosine(37)-N1)-methyltransferase TrmD [Gammaproteobacteria bacterium]MDE0479406.1 tRNA (guanosine(37)-N1)-methyltransferase TrmD [Gammaproteobacteria bacterium]MYA66861.1 tRNA (guanosine(37)-N1)-methyltransferase TrmD [Gammaproteobacteria bacterium]MYC58891.1 tRNA (guanosine(37)-N1)-methyltransferase TrmD [Gammaproteobacteria bacterium]MYH46751.1 tRNA (guanosine(37)-N1)-methyltransferase TrmD [Gammaproteobacteria bacterium]
MRVDIVTLFPEMFTALSEYGVTGRAVGQGLVELAYWNPRDYARDRHRTVDDRPFGGGPGMLMKTAPLLDSLAAAQQEGRGRVIYLSPQGRRLDHETVVRLASMPKLVLLCGRYQGVDQRVIDSAVDEEVSLGDFVISGGELAAMALIDAIIRLLPGALGDEDSAGSDSFADGLLLGPEYTRPREVAREEAPEVLLSGDHEAIRRWRLMQKLGTTWRRRPDLLAGRELNEEEQRLLDEYRAGMNEN